MEELHSSCFANPAQRKYPVHTKEAALKSYKTYSKEKASYIPEKQALIEENFRKAASLHDITYPELTKEAAKEIPTVSFRVGDQFCITMSKTASLDGLYEQAGELNNIRGVCSGESLRKAASYIFLEAVKKNADLDRPEMRKISALAGFGIGDREHIIEAFAKRASSFSRDSDEYKYVMGIIRTVESMDDDAFYKKACLDRIFESLDRIDSVLCPENMSKYGRELETPESVCYEKQLTDVYKEVEDCLLVHSTGTVLSKQALLERSLQVDGFFFDHYGQVPYGSNEEMFTKIANLPQEVSEALIEELK